MTASENPAPSSEPLSPLDAFTSDITRPKLSALYIAGLAVVAFAMVLLPLIYIGLIALAGWAVYFHLTQDTWIFNESGGGVIKMILYFGPAIVGIILVVFMLKPLFAKSPKREELVSLDPKKEELLFAFVQRICRLVGAPMPSRIDVDCQVNASASLQRGIWSRDLVLTIGMPLAAGLDMREFAGVLAHEFGHFAQGAGMRLTYVIRRINFWFARVVYERDSFDVDLERSAKNTDFRIAIILHAARGCIWLTRRVLWALMHAGIAISSFMLRQMEYDADSYESKVAGSDAFESTAKSLRVLNTAAQVAIGDVQQSWTGQRLPEDLPLLIGHKVGSLSSDVHQKLAEAASATKTKWFDTHPCDTDRVKAARLLNEPGVFLIGRPAAELFSNFADTSKAVTRHHYEKTWELQFSDENLVSSAEMLQESTASVEAEAAVRKYFKQVNISLVPLLTANGSAPQDTGDGLSQWQAACARGEQLQDAAVKASAEHEKQVQSILGFNTARYLAAARFTFQPADFGLSADATSREEQILAAKRATDDATRIMDEQLKPVEQFVSALRTRCHAVLELSKSAQSLPESTVSEIETILPILAAVGSTLPSLHQLGMRLHTFVILARNRGNHPNPSVVDTQFSILTEEMRKLLDQIQAPLGSLPYPFPHSRGKITVVQYARYEKACETKWETAYREGNAHVERLFSLHYRLLGRYLVLVEAAEKDWEAKSKSPAFATTG